MAQVPDFLLHHDGDSVAVANDDLQPGTLQGPVSYTHLTLPTNREV